MSNVETVQSIYEAFGRGDIPAILEKVAESVRWEAWDVENSVQEAGVAWMRPRSGRDEVAGFFEDVAASLEFHGFEPRNLLAGGNQVAATIFLDVTVKATGERLQDEEIHLWTFDDEGRITGLRHYVDTAKHIKATKAAAAEVA